MIDNPSKNTKNITRTIDFSNGVNIPNDATNANDEAEYVTKLIILEMIHVNIIMI